MLQNNADNKPQLPQPLAASVNWREMIAYGGTYSALEKGLYLQALTVPIGGIVASCGAPQIGAPIMLTGLTGCAVVYAFTAAANLTSRALGHPSVFLIDQKSNKTWSPEKKTGQLSPMIAGIAFSLATLIASSFSHTAQPEQLGASETLAPSSQKIEIKME